MTTKPTSGTRLSRRSFEVRGVTNLPPALLCKDACVLQAAGQSALWSHFVLHASRIIRR